MRFVFVAASLGSFMLVAACTSDSTSTPSTNVGDHSSVETADASSTDASAAILPADAQTIVATSKGGMARYLDVDPTSTCRPADNTFTLVLASRQLRWKSCSDVANDGGLVRLDYVEGEKTLTETEYASVTSALDALVLSNRGCGADKPKLTLEVTTPHGTTTFLDDFYRCNKDGNYVHGLDAVFGQFDTLTSSPHSD